MTDKDREEARRMREEFEILGDKLYDLDKCSTTNRYATESTQIAWENWIVIWTRIRAEAKAEVLRDAAERAVKWFDWLWLQTTGDTSKLYAEHLRAAILADEPRTCETCDIDTDALTIDRALRYPDHFPGLDASGALERLVSLARQPNAPQSADAEMVREYRRLLISALDALYEAVEIAPLYRLPSKASGVIQDIQATIGDDAIALDRVVGKEE